MILWILLTVMIALAAAGLTIPLVRRYDQRPQARTVDILKGQLGEVDAQVAAKLIAAGEADAQNWRRCACTSINTDSTTG